MSNCIEKVLTAHGFCFSGKKGKKSKGKTVSLNDFLSDGKSGPDTTTVTIPKNPKSWADEVYNNT